LSFGMNGSRVAGSSGRANTNTPPRFKPAGAAAFGSAPVWGGVGCSFEHALNIRAHIAPATHRTELREAIEAVAPRPSLVVIFLVSSGMYAGSGRMRRGAILIQPER